MGGLNSASPGPGLAGKGTQRAEEQGQDLGFPGPAPLGAANPHPVSPAQGPGQEPTLEAFGGEMQINGVGPVGHVPYLGGVHLCLALPNA